MGKYDIDNFEKWAEENIDFEDPTTHFTRVLCNEMAEANRLKRIEITQKAIYDNQHFEDLVDLREELEDKA